MSVPSTEDVISLMDLGAIGQLDDIDELNANALVHDERVRTRVVGLLTHSDVSIQLVALSFLNKAYDRTTSHEPIPGLLPRLSVLVESDVANLQRNALRLVAALVRFSREAVVDAGILSNVIRVSHKSDDEGVLTEAIETMTVLIEKGLISDAARAKALVIDSGAASGMFRVLTRDYGTASIRDCAVQFIDMVPDLRDELLSMAQTLLSEEAYASSSDLLWGVGRLCLIDWTSPIAAVNRAVLQIAEWLDDAKHASFALRVVTKMTRGLGSEQLRICALLIPRLSKFLRFRRVSRFFSSILCHPPLHMALIVGGAVPAMVKVLELHSARQSWENCLSTINGLLTWLSYDACLRCLIRARFFSKLSHVVCAKTIDLVTVFNSLIGRARAPRDRMDSLVRHGCVRPLLEMLLHTAADDADDAYVDEAVMRLIDMVHSVCARATLRTELSRLDSVIAFERLEACRQLNVPARKEAILTGMFMRRAGTVCIGLQALNLPALMTLEILDALIPNTFTMHFEWQVITKVKHFHDRQSDVLKLRERTALLQEQLQESEAARRAAEANVGIERRLAAARVAALMEELRQYR